MFAPANLPVRHRSPWGIATLLLLVIAVVCANGCGNTSQSAEKKSSVPAELPDVDADALTVQFQPWPLTVRAQGTLVADEVAVVGTKVPGRVEEVHVDLGDVVHTGDPVVTLDREEYKLQVTQAEAQLDQAVAVVGLKSADGVAQLDRENSPPVRRAKALWDEAKATLARTQTLYEQKAINEAELEQAVTAERVAETQFASALNNVNEMIAAIGVRSAELAIAEQRLHDAIVTAPFDGMIQQRYVAPGSFVPVGQALVSVVRTNRLRFRATMPERHAQRLAHGQEVRLQIESIPEPRVVKITRISPVVDELSRALLFEADVDNSDGELRTGLFAEAEVVLDPEAQAISVPAAAVNEFAGVEKVWKVVEGKVTEQIVRTGPRGERGVQIDEGLVAGDQILCEARFGRPGHFVGKTVPTAATTASTQTAAASTLTAQEQDQESASQE